MTDAPVAVTHADEDAAQDMLNHAFRHVGARALKNVEFSDIALAFARHRHLAEQATEARLGAGGEHSDDRAVDLFADRMKAKLAAARDKGRGGWDDPSQCSTDYLRQLLHEHVVKGDPVDVANFCMMLAHYGAPTSSPDSQPAAQVERVGDLKAWLEVVAASKHARFPGQLTDHIYASDCPACVAKHLLRQWPHASPTPDTPAGSTTPEAGEGGPDVSALRGAEKLAHLMAWYHFGIRWDRLERQSQAELLAACQAAMDWLNQPLPQRLAALSPAIDSAAGSERLGEQRAIVRVVNVAREIAWQAGVGGRETAGAILSYLATSPDEIEPFVAGQLSPLDFKGDWMRGGCLTWHGADGKVWSPEEAAAARAALSQSQSTESGA